MTEGPSDLDSQVHPGKGTGPSFLLPGRQTKLGCCGGRTAGLTQGPWAELEDEGRASRQCRPVCSLWAFTRRGSCMVHPTDRAQGACERGGLVRGIWEGVRQESPVRRRTSGSYGISHRPESGPDPPKENWPRVFSNLASSIFPLLGALEPRWIAAVSSCSVGGTMLFPL